MTSYDIGVIGFGAMGKWFAHLYEEDGHRIRVYDTNHDRLAEAQKLGYKTASSGRELAAKSNVTMVSVLPIRNSLDVIEDVGPILEHAQGLFDITSLKEKQLQAMRTYVERGQYFGTHPMYAEGLFRDQTTLLVPGNSTEWYQWFKDFCVQGGSIIKETTGAKNDDMMAIIQGLLHCAQYTTGHAFRKALGTHERALEVREFESPIYRAALNFVFRIHARNPELYWDIANENRGRVLPYLRGFREAVDDYIRQLEEGDFDAFLEDVETTRKVFGEMVTEGSDESTSMIRALPRRNDDH